MFPAELSLNNSPLGGAIKCAPHIMITHHFIQINELSSSSCVLQSRLVQITALSPRLEQLAAEAGSLGAVPSLKDNMVVVSAHHASTLQRLQSRELEVNKGTFAELYQNHLLNQQSRGNLFQNSEQVPRYSQYHMLFKGPDSLEASSYFRELQDGRTRFKPSLKQRPISLSLHLAQSFQVYRETERVIAKISRAQSCRGCVNLTSVLYESLASHK